MVNTPKLIFSIILPTLKYFNKYFGNFRTEACQIRKFFNYGHGWSWMFNGN